jgi:hypothetical protein
MNLSRTIARYIVVGGLLAAPAILVRAQENKPEETKRKNTEGNKSERPARPEHTAPAGQQAAPAPQRHENAQPEHARPTPAPAQGRPSRPVTQPPAGQAPQPRQARPDSPLPNRGNTQPATGAQPGRTFGNTAPNRGTEPRVAEPHGSAPLGTRPVGPPNRTFTTRTGDVIHRDSSGQVRQVRMSNGTVVYHPPNAPRRVEVVRPGGRLVVASSPGHGYVQRPIIVNNTTIVKRTYIYNGVPQARIFRPRVFNGVTLAIYTPVRFYRPAFYVYAYNSWPRPIVFAWGWGGSPWYGYYGGYFTPYPAYASPSLWLTDYLIAATLESAYQERMAAAQAASAGNMYASGGGQSAPMTPEVKQAIADEVRRQIDRERAAGQNGTNPQDTNIFTDNGPHVFVASATLMVNSSVGECTVGEGDVLQMNGAPPNNSASADLMVLSSRGQDCRKGSMVSVALQDLQEMQNQMQATIDRGMGDLQSKQGQGGLPALPQGSAGTIDSPYAQAAQPDANVATELTSVTQEADRAEQQAVSQSGDATAPPTLSLGLSIEDVKAIQGEPQKVVDLGSKKIYVYKDLKITFTDGKVSDIQ